MGRQWLTLIAPIGAYRQAFIDAYPIVAPDPTQTSDADRCAHPQVWRDSSRRSPAGRWTAGRCTST